MSDYEKLGEILPIMVKGYSEKLIHTIGINPHITLLIALVVTSVACYMTFNIDWKKVKMKYTKYIIQVITCILIFVGICVLFTTAYYLWGNSNRMFALCVAFMHFSAVIGIPSCTIGIIIDGNMAVEEQEG